MAIVGKVTIGQLDDLDEWLGAYATPKAFEPTASTELIGQAIQEFRVFATEYLDYFHTLSDSALGNGITRIRLETRALQAFDEYWTPLGEVAAQNLLWPYRKHLDEGTKLASDYLNQLGINLPGVVVYFNKVNSIRFFPYTNVAFVAVPYTHIARKDADWMSIPHELGHYLYWNLAVNLVDVRAKHAQVSEQARNTLQNAPELTNRPEQEKEAIIAVTLGWLEEIFADVVGIILAGAQFATSFHTLLAEAADGPKSLTEDDGNHPPLCLRPFLREHVLTLLGQPMTGTDWRQVMLDEFGADILSLVLRTQQLNAESLLRAQSLDDLVALLGGSEDILQNKIQTIQWSVYDAIALVNRLAGNLIAVATELPSIRNRSTDKSFAFEQLKKLAESKAPINTPPFIDALLTPVILEGGVRHSHGGYGHWRYHSIGAHNH